MSALDAGFWQLEDGQVALHIGCAAVFAGPAPAFDAIRDRYARVASEIPRYRQRMRAVPLDLERPVWVVAADFTLADHLIRTALPAPGGERELLSLIGRIMSTPLDPHRPLWQAWVVEGLAEDRWAIVLKVHHSVVDGMGGMDLLTGLLDPSPGTAHLRHRRPTEPRAHETLDTVHLVIDAMTGTVRAGRRAMQDVAALGTHPRRAIRQFFTSANGGLDYAGAVTHPVTATSLTGPLGSARRYRVATVELADVNQVRAALGGTVNDVALTMIARGFRELLLRRHEKPGPRTVRTLVPVSVRSPSDRPAVANKVSALLLDLPVDYGDAGDAYGAVQARMRLLKASGEATAIALATDVAQWLPAPLVSGAVRTVRHLPQHVLTTVTTNVPGPRAQVHLLGHNMLALYPYVPIGEQLRLGVAVTSYNGRLHFGVTSDRDSVPEVDVDAFTTSLTAGLRQLLEYACDKQGVRA